MPGEISQAGVTQLRERMTQTFSATYLTLLSIIQGTTVALLFSTVQGLLGRGEFHAPQLVLTIGLFLIIVLLWHQYQIGVILYEWVPQIVDAVIPFVLGACEFIAILGLQYGSLVTAATFAVFFVLGLFGLEYQFYQVSRATTPKRSPKRSSRSRSACACVRAALRSPKRIRARSAQIRVATARSCASSARPKTCSRSSGPRHIADATTCSVD